MPNAPEFLSSIRIRETGVALHAGCNHTARVHRASNFACATMLGYCLSAGMSGV